MARPETRQELFATENDIRIAKEFVHFALGDDFVVDYTGLPKNVGVMGDEGVIGHSVLIIPINGNLQAFYEGEGDLDLLDRLVHKITGHTKSASRVLIDITPNLPPGLPFFEVEEITE